MRSDGTINIRFPSKFISFIIGVQLGFYASAGIASRNTTLSQFCIGITAVVYGTTRPLWRHNSTLTMYVKLGALAGGLIAVAPQLIRRQQHLLQLNLGH